MLKGEKVRVVPLPGDRNQKWFKAEVEESADVESYDVRMEDKRILRRNRRHLSRSREPFTAPKLVSLQQLQQSGHPSITWPVHRNPKPQS